jgi:hypothetical protein
MSITAYNKNLHNTKTMQADNLKNLTLNQNNPTATHL